ncbi:MAG: adenylate/guanylate cyclase domain-containing protein [Verrucomicrobia bacterium]|nr:adenylate/guanylate cyclase domain-containing protein [Verrucomicrobiota bacterium]
MRYRTKLYLALIIISFLSSGFGLWIMYNEATKFVWTELRAKALTVAATTAALIDPELLKQIHTRADEGSPAYIAVQNELRRARDANRRQNIFVSYLYTLQPDPQNPKILLYQVDAEESPKYVSHAGDIDNNSVDFNIAAHLNSYYAPEQFVTDPYGTWMSGYAPVFDRQGNYVATVGVDISASSIYTKLNRLIYDGFLGLLGSLALGLLGGYFLSRRVSISLSTLCTSVEKIGEGNLDHKVTLNTSDEFEDLAKAINSMSQGLKERERLKMNFTRYVSQHMLDTILKSEMPTNLQGERKKITVLFSDIRQFTQLSEQLPPEQVVSLLNAYLEVMIDVVFSHQGTLDKFIGDAIMVEFGAPMEDEQQELHALETAIAMHKAMQVLGDRLEKEGNPRLVMGIGIHTGLAIVGNIGSEKRMEYTAIGDTVNVAARLEKLTKKLQTPILISETTYRAIKDRFPMKNLGPMTITGKQAPIEVYALYPFGEVKE